MAQKHLVSIYRTERASNRSRCLPILLADRWPGIIKAADDFRRFYFWTSWRRACRMSRLQFQLSRESSKQKNNVLKQETNIVSNTNRC